MQIVILGDLHFGCRSNNKYFYNKQIEFFNTELFPYLQTNDIHTIIQTGDLFDVRKNISLETLHNIKNDFFNVLEDLDVKFYTLAGNHDLFFRNASDIYTSPLVLSDYSNVHCVTEFETILFDDKNIDLVGWLCKDNELYILEQIKNSISSVVIGHFELSGFPMFKGIDAIDGYSAKFLSHYDRVISGHYHTKSAKGNVDYVGVPYEMCFSDANDIKGFHVLDTKTNELEFIPSNINTHHKIYYPVDNPITEKLDRYSNKIVNLVITKTDKNLERYIDRLYKCKPHILTFDDITAITINTESVEIKTEDTITVLITAVNDSDVNNKGCVIGVMKEVYQEVLT